MSGDFEMLDAHHSSQVSKPGPSGRNGLNGRSNGNGRPADGSSMSEDDAMPLVRFPSVAYERCLKNDLTNFGTCCHAVADNADEV